MSINEKSISEVLSTNITKVFEDSGITKAEAQRRCGMSNQSFNGLMNAEGNIQVKRVETFAEAFGVRYGDLFSEEYVANRVSKPRHYNVSPIETIDTIEDIARNHKGVSAKCVSDIVKYIARQKFKNGVEDLEKALWYFDHFITVTDYDVTPDDGIGAIHGSLHEHAKSVSSVYEDEKDSARVEFIITALFYMSNRRIRANMKDSVRNHIVELIEIEKGNK